MVLWHGMGFEMDRIHSWLCTRSGGWKGKQGGSQCLRRETIVIEFGPNWPSGSGKGCESEPLLCLLCVHVDWTRRWRRVDCTELVTYIVVSKECGKSKIKVPYTDQE